VRRGVVRVKVKLLLFIILLAVVPIISVNIVTSSQNKENFTQLFLNNTENIVSNQSESVNFYFEEIVSSAKALSSSENVRNYISASNSDGFEINEDDRDYVIISDEIKYISDYDTSLEKIMLINNSGMIIASTDDEDTGKTMSNYDGLFALSHEHNGVSTLFMSGEKEHNIPVFIVAKSIYSYDNEQQGIVYELYNTGYIQNLVNNAQIDKFSTVSLMDFGGNLLEYPFKTVRGYSDNDNYKGADSFISNLLNSGNDSKYKSPYEYGSGRNSKVIFSSDVSSCDWTMLAVSDRIGLETFAKKGSGSLRTISFIIVIVACIFMGLFIVYFTKPIDEIIDIFRKRQNNSNSNIQFNIRTRDEFGYIGRAFNSIMNDLFESDQRYRALVDITNNIVFEVDFKKNEVIVSKNFNKKFSYRPKDDSVKESFLYNLRIHKDDKDRYMSDLEKILGTANFMQGEYRVKSIYGDFIWVMIKATKFFNRDDVPTKIVGVIMDIDKEKKSEMHLIQRASYDALTQIYNRETFLKSLSAEIELSTVKKSLDAVMFIDLDDFKFFNDEYGHACGDEVLKFVADTLKEICFERGFAGRFGGDEFVACITNLTLYGDSGKIAQEVIDILGRGFTSESTGMKLNIHCSIGIAFLRESGNTTDEVVAAADEAMYNIKKHGKSAYTYAKSEHKSDPATILATSGTSQIDSDVNAAEDNNE
ncbi:MAG: diguanylate cyclase, partial [Oscillospiraceae bacterium]|nr:diguanylate cyclase [Oscillospiraceae bacterium]